MLIVNGLPIVFTNGKLGDMVHKSKSLGVLKCASIEELEKHNYSYSDNYELIRDMEEIE